LPIDYTKTSQQSKEKFWSVRVECVFFVVFPD